jgi:hypothetical protein
MGPRNGAGDGTRGDDSRGARNRAAALEHFEAEGRLRLHKK